MKLNFYNVRAISSAATDLIQFDADSIRQIVTGQHRRAPDTWLVDPDGYEKNGRILRDTESPRMLAYSATDHVLYATDGCNSCARQMRAKLEELSTDALRAFAAENELSPKLLEHLAELVRTAAKISEH